jgi:hypothetical protein
VTWSLIEKSNEIEDVSAFLKEYPQGRFAPAARVRLQQLQRLANQQRTEEQQRLATQERQRREREEVAARQRAEEQRVAAQERQRREREEAEARQRAEEQRREKQTPQPAQSARPSQPLQVARLEPAVPKREEKVGRFIKYDNGTALDTKTNLMWMTKDFRNIEGRAPKDWDEAMGWVEKMNRRNCSGMPAG